MSQSRLRNPLHSLVQTSIDLVAYLRYVSGTEFVEVMKPVRDEYESPKKSWIWSAFYTRNRVARLNQMIDKISEYEGDDVGKLILDEVADILSEEKTGWEATSANTTILHALIRQIHNYDPEENLTNNEIIEFSKLLLDAIENRFKAENNLSREESRLKEIEDQKSKLEDDVLKIQESLVRKQEEIIEKEDKLKLLQIEQDVSLKQIENERAQKEAELRNYQLQLEDIEREQKKREADLALARQTLRLLDPEIDLQKMGVNEVESIVQEVTLVAKAAAQTYIHERNEILRQKAERARLSGTISAAKKNLSGQQVGGVQVEDATLTNQAAAKVAADAQQRKLEAAQLCAQRTAKANDENVRAYLGTFFGKRIRAAAEKAQKEKQQEQRNNEERGSIAKLYSEGARTRILNPEALAAVATLPLKKRTVKKPVSSNPEFMAAFELLNTTYKPTTYNAAPNVSPGLKESTVLPGAALEPSALATLDSVRIQEDYAEEQVEIKNQQVAQPEPLRTLQPGVIPPPPPSPGYALLAQQARMFRLQASPAQLLTATQQLQKEVEECVPVEVVRI